jgi:hypothetical protein
MSKEARENCVAKSNEEALERTREQIPPYEERLNFPLMDREPHRGNVVEVIGKASRVA